jgi:hypothetical protein
MPDITQLAGHIADAFAELVKASVRNSGHWS